jgi:hypothetical protein
MAGAQRVAHDPIKLLLNLPGQPSWRRLRLAAVACCRRMERLLTDERSRRALDYAELYADKMVDVTSCMEVEQAASDVIDPAHGIGDRSKHNAAYCAATCLALWASADWGTYRVFEGSVPIIGREEQLRILACVFDAPGRQPHSLVPFDPAWRTSTVMALAAGVYEERAFDRLPILADALQDAGCDADAILDHFRDPAAAHVRGCWALDLVLGKE